MKENHHPEINIALAFDENFITPFYVLLTSIFENNRDNKIILHVIATGVDEEEKSEISRYVEANMADIYFYNLSEQKKLESLQNIHLESARYTIAIYYRLFFAIIIPESVKKVLYMDVDTIVLQNLADLYNLNINPFPVAAVKDNTFGILNEKDLLEATGIDVNDYFNSGVLLIDTGRWKEEKISERTLKFISENKNLLKYPDQDALNHVLKNNWYKLSNLFNFGHSEISIQLTKKEVLKNNKIVIIHYTSSKPWHFTNSARLRSIYYGYFKKSPYTKKKKYIDFTWTKHSFRGYIYIRLLEFYLDHPAIRNIWKKIKSK